MRSSIPRRPFLLLVLAACANGPMAPGMGSQNPGYTPTTIGEADLRVLFVGNSLTYSNNLPGIVAELAAASGLSFAYAARAEPNWSLEEHWKAGIGQVIAETRPDIVILQQGPSSLPASQQHLAHWAARLDPVIRQAGGQPALLMVWPDESRAAYFPDVRDSYRNAAAVIDGLFIPGGQAWVEAWALDPDLRMWSVDGFHPTPLGTVAAAMATFAVLFGADPAAIPLLVVDGVSAEHAALLRKAVTAALR